MKLFILVYCATCLCCCKDASENHNANNHAIDFNLMQLNPKMFIVDIDGVPWIMASYQNNSDNNAKINLDPLYDIYNYSVITRETKSEIPFVSNYIGFTNSMNDSSKYLSLPKGDAAFIIVAFPPVDLDERLNSKELFDKYMISHEEFGCVELFK